MIRLLRSPIALGVIALVLLITLASTVSIVPETKQAVIVRFGQPVRVINGYQANAQLGPGGAGLTARIPFVEQIHWIDKRVLSLDMDNQPVLSTDQLRLEVDAFARFRITNPLQMYVAARTEENLANQLKPILASVLRNEFGRRPSAALLTPERGEMMTNITNTLNRYAAQYGAEIVDVRIKRADLPNGTPLDSAYERMRTARRQEATSIVAQGNRQATIIRAEAEAEAAATYAAAFNRDPEFYDFYRAMQSYRSSFLGTRADGQRGRSSIILSPNNDYLRQFRGQR
jgi:modulator of FtsH protease HflC